MQTCTVTKTVTSTVRQAFCQKIMSQNARDSYRKIGIPEIHIDLHFHVTVTQKYPDTHTPPELVTKTLVLSDMHCHRKNYTVPEMRDPVCQRKPHRNSRDTHALLQRQTYTFMIEPHR